jgi:hypothetical protein
LVVLFSLACESASPASPCESAPRRPTAPSRRPHPRDPIHRRGAAAASHPSELPRRRPHPSPHARPPLSLAASTPHARPSPPHHPSLSVSAPLQTLSEQLYRFAPTTSLLSAAAVAPAAAFGAPPPSERAAAAGAAGCAEATNALLCNPSVPPAPLGAVHG